MWRRGKKQEAAPPVASPVVSLRLMSAEEYTAFRSFLDADYARDVARAMDIPLDEAQALADKQLADLLKDGLRSEGHHLWKVIAQDEAVGDLWLFADAGKRKAFVYFIGIDERWRGKGYGRAAMLAMETEVKAIGLPSVGLSVFGDNSTARSLYESLGYQPTAINMRKIL